MTPVNAPEVVVWATICELRQEKAAIIKYEAKRRCADQSCIEPPQEIRLSTSRFGRAIIPPSSFPIQFLNSRKVHYLGPSKRVALLCIDGRHALSPPILNVHSLSSRE